MQEGKITDQMKAWGAVEDFLEPQVKKSKFGMGSEQALLVEMSKPAWDEDFHEFKSLPETAEKTEVLEKQKDESDAVEAEIAALAKRLVDTGENLRAGGGLGLLSAP